MSAKPTLYSFFRSSCSWRVRIALALKNIEYECKTINLLKNEHKSEEFLAINPMGKVPVFVHNGNKLSQSPAILEYLDEVYPDYPLLPNGDPLKNCKIRNIALLIAADIQPLQNPSVFKYLGGNGNKFATWAVINGLEAVEKELLETSGRYTCGNEITLADIYLVPQVYNAVARFNIEIQNYPVISKVYSELFTHDSFLKTHPKYQPDFIDS